MQINNELHKIEQNTNELPTIDIVFPLHSRAWCLPYFLDNIYNLDYPKDKISIITYLNNAFDGSDQIMYNFKKNHTNEYNKIDIYTYNLNIPQYDNNGQRGSSIVSNTPINGSLYKQKIKNTAYDVYKGLAKLRNLLLNKTTSDFVFSIDTDIICPNNTLKELIKLNKDFLSCLICNGHMVAKDNDKINPYSFLNIMQKANNNQYGHIQLDLSKDNGIILVDLSGAVSLMSRKLVKSGAKYSDVIVKINNREIHYGEDAGFCKTAQELGFELFCNTDLKCIHLMSPEYLEKYLKGEFIF